MDDERNEAHMACRDARVLEDGDMAECIACGKCVRWDLRDDGFWGFKATCDDAEPDQPGTGRA